MLLAMVMTGLPTGEVHAHADGDHDHDHVVYVLAHGASDHDDSSVPSEPESDKVLHPHDVCASTTALLSIYKLTLDVLVAHVPGVAMLNPPPPTAARIPPHRPPIA